MTFSLDLDASGRSRTTMGGFGPGLGLEEIAGDEESLEGGRDDVVDEGVTGRPVVLEEGEGTGDLRERNGEMEDRSDLLDIFRRIKSQRKVKALEREGEKMEGGFTCRREEGEDRADL